MKYAVAIRRPQTVDETIHFLIEVWNTIPSAVVSNLISSMKHQCEQVLIRNGE
jgi:hypothetical protein